MKFTTGSMDGIGEGEIHLDLYITNIFSTRTMHLKVRGTVRNTNFQNDVYEVNVQFADISNLYRADLDMHLARTMPK
jgi:hypothetical protein